MGRSSTSAVEKFSEAELVRSCARGDRAAMEQVIATNNQRLFRTAFSILKDRGEAEEAMQSAYLAAFTSIAGFEGRSMLSTWLTRIVANEALARLRAQRRRRAALEREGVAVFDAYREALMRGSEPTSPEAAVAREELRLLLERAIARLPVSFRVVFVLREVEGLSGEETAEALQIPEATVKTRLLRARRRLQAMLGQEVASALSGTFPFAGADCAALSAKVLAAMPHARAADPDSKSVSGEPKSSAGI